MTLRLHMITTDARIHRATVGTLAAFGTVAGATACRPNLMQIGVPVVPTYARNKLCGACIVGPNTVEVL